MGHYNYAPEGRHRIDSNLQQQQGGNGIFPIRNIGQSWTPHLYVGTLRFGLIACLGLATPVDRM